MTRNGRSGGRRGYLAPAATAALVILLMLALSGVGQLLLSNNDSDDQASAADVTVTADSTPEEREALEKRSPATRLSIPAIDVDTRLVRLGTAATKTIELPPADRAGWYAAAAAPGQVGVSIIAGYIARSKNQPGIFRDLRKLRDGDSIEITRADGKVVTYEVLSIKNYATGKFPTKKFYTSNDLPILRIVTTGGKLRPGAPQGNVIVEATLTDVR